MKYVIRERGLEGNLIVGAIDSSSAAQLHPFNFDEEREVQMVPIINRLVRPTCYMTRSATDKLFNILAPEGRQ